MPSKQLDALALSKATGASLVTANKWLDYLKSAMLRFGIDTGLRQAAFLSQIGHESGGLVAVEENLNYSSAALLRVFKKYFPTPEIAAQFARKPEKIANKVYADRMGNGNERSGDGWRYRGRGPIQLTGKSNYIEAGKDLGIDLVNNPDLAALPEVGSLVAAWFWRRNNLNKWADAGDIDGVSDVVNMGRKTIALGDANGYDHRLALYKAGIEALT